MVNRMPYKRKLLIQKTTSVRVFSATCFSSALVSARRAILAHTNFYIYYYVNYGIRANEQRKVSQINYPNS